MENSLKVFVLNMRGQPLMPCSPPKAHKLLRAGKAVPVRRTPFVIQLTVPTGETKQPITLGVDAGYKHVGLSATTAKEALLASEVYGLALESLGTSPRPTQPQDPLPCAAF
ncbi:RRXRR domain-containing protein [Duodenibacillus massiliensis]|uniref:RRXRR domain-containing protein n=1 Tax=Duodenibacillus massiliensis TaxID=1852381 RepID=UPI0022870DD7|nr:RRXRR domain-containing protein [Duodenibacillus massiliensis]